MKFELYSNQDLIGEWLISYKIDGVRCHNTELGMFSRKGKPLYNIPNFDGQVAEIFCGDFKTTIEKTRSSTKDYPVNQDEIFILYPKIDNRLLIGVYTNPTQSTIQNLFLEAKLKGYEGLVLRNGEKLLKVKSKETYDVIIEAVIEGTGKNKNKLGAFLTNMGKVGTGFTDKERLEYYKESLIGETIEVDCMELTPSGKFRHPRFIRLREDK